MLTGYERGVDIALIELKPNNGSYIKFEDGIEPICLPDQDQEYSENLTCTVAGWGRNTTEEHPDGDSIY